jgi:hypothetical protein
MAPPCCSPCQAATVHSSSFREEHSKTHQNRVLRQARLLRQREARARDRAEIVEIREQAQKTIQSTVTATQTEEKMISMDEVGVQFKKIFDEMKKEYVTIDEIVDYKVKIDALEFEKNELEEKLHSAHVKLEKSMANTFDLMKLKKKYSKSAPRQFAYLLSAMNKIDAKDCESSFTDFIDFMIVDNSSLKEHIEALHEEISDLHRLYEEAEESDREDG